MLGFGFQHENVTQPAYSNFRSRGKVFEKF